MRSRQALWEFLHDLHEPGPEFMTRDRMPLQQRHLLLFRQGLTLVFGLSTLVLISLRVTGR